MSPRADGAAAWRLGTCAAEAPYCAGFAVQLRGHGRSSGALLGGDATRRIAQFIASEAYK